MNVVGIIPARMESSRFPGKPLVDILGVPMVGHVYFRSKMCKAFSEVYIATCDEKIREYAESVGAKCIMTADTHERCSDRTAEAMLKIENELREKVDVVVMIQGDEPMVRPEMIERALNALLGDADVQIVSLMSPIDSGEDFFDPNAVKVVVDLNGDALYFSREPIPSRKKWPGDIPMYKQFPIIPFRRDYLLKFNAMEPTPLEQIESVDMMRILEHGGKVRMAVSDLQTQAVDTLADLERVSIMMRDDPLMAAYLSRPADG